MHFYKKEHFEEQIQPILEIIPIYIVKMIKY